MTISLRTKRLLIRDYRKADSQDVLEFLGDEQTMYYLPEKPHTLEMVEQLIVKQKEKSEYYAVVLQDEAKVIGHLYFTHFFGDHSYEIGWVFNKAYQGFGYATEAARAVLDYGFKQLGIHRVIATCQPKNVGSYKVMEHLGMRREGFFKECIPVNDQWWDEYYYAILAKEWLYKEEFDGNC